MRGTKGNWNCVEAHHNKLQTRTKRTGSVKRVKDAHDEQLFRFGG